MQIAIGSTSDVKLAALRDACDRLDIDCDIVPVRTESGVNAQPFGLAETWMGAHNRMIAAQATCPGTIAIGIENGIIEVGNRQYIDLAVIYLRDHNGREFVGTSASVMFPYELVEEARQRGFATTTVGSLIAKNIGGYATDPHSMMTAGVTSRQDILTEALVCILSQAAIS